MKGPRPRGNVGHGVALAREIFPLTSDSEAVAWPDSVVKILENS